MHKTLYLVRHGKSDWDQMDTNDLERPLKKRGVENCEAMAKRMQTLKLQPELVLSSPAIRAYETAKIFAEILAIPSPRFKVNERLYLPDFPTLLKTILYLNNDYNNVLIVGHEPSLSTAINYFINHPLEKVITGSLTVLSFATSDWRDISPSEFKSGKHYNRHDLEGFVLK
jgi:phosphohistidine phosphatase